jgi:hypothetical protein
MLRTCVEMQKMSLATVLWTIMRNEAFSSIHSNHALSMSSHIIPFRPVTVSSRLNHHASMIRQSPSSDSPPLSNHRKPENIHDRPQDVYSHDQNENNDLSALDAIIPVTRAKAVEPVKKGENNRQKKGFSSRVIARVPPPISKKKAEPWKVQKAVLKEKFKEGWNPPKKLSPDAIDGIRHLHATAPDKFTTPVLAQHFEMSPEAIRRILRTKWLPSEEERAKRRERWNRRHDRIWSQMAQLGLRPKSRRLAPISDMRLIDSKIH